jgi:hypothetical protein
MGLVWGSHPEEDAMKTLSRFIAKFTSLIVAMLSGFITKASTTTRGGAGVEGEQSLRFDPPRRLT